MSVLLHYISSYPADLQQQVQEMIDEDSLQQFLLGKYPAAHKVANDGQLREYVMDIKNTYMKKTDPLSKIVYDSRIHVINNALGLHTYISRVQGDKLKSKNEIRVSTVFKKAPEEFLKMIVVHELAHLREKDHNKNFYQLCEHMLPGYHQLEFDARLYLIQLELGGSLYN
ncbi:MAG: M48 family metallopeptidase [Pseudomonadota bacterium]